MGNEAAAIRARLSRAWLEETNVVPRLYIETLQSFPRGRAPPALDALVLANRDHARRLQRVLSNLSEGRYGEAP